MPDMVKIAAIAVAAALCAVVVKKNVAELGMVLALCAGAIILSCSLGALEGVKELMDTLADTAGLSPAVLAPVVKTVGIAVLTRVSAELCRDAKEGGIAAFVETAGAAAALFALVVARPIIHLRGDYLLIVTIGIVEIVRIALINDVFGLTGGANGIFGIARPEIFGIKIRKAIQFYYLIWIMVGLTVLLFHWLSESRFGRALNCIKEDDTAAEGCGMDVAHLKLMAFVIGAFWAGMAGNLFAAKMTIISPSSFTFWESVVVFAVVILSGGSQIGVLLGTFLIVALPEMFRDFASARMLVFGLAMMIMMVVRPQGLLPPSPRLYDVRRLLRRTRDFSSPVAPRTARKEGAA